MNNRELLEMAAKAAGIEWDFINEERGMYLLDGGWWNPLKNHDDSKNLRHRLHLTTLTTYSAVIVRNKDSSVVVEEQRNISKKSTLRRAIVRCAAIIGSEMKNAP